MLKFRRTRTVSEIDWNLAVNAYEAMYKVAIDLAVPQQWYDENKDELSRRMGACWVYAPGNILGEPLFRDDLLRGLGVFMGYEEVPE